jgi:hypothetical protein
MHTSLRLLEGVSLVKRSCTGIRKDLLVTEEIAESSDLRATPFEFEVEQERDAIPDERNEPDNAGGA